MESDTPKIGYAGFSCMVKEIIQKVPKMLCQICRILLYVENQRKTWEKASPSVNDLPSKFNVTPNTIEFKAESKTVIFGTIFQTKF